MKRSLSLATTSILVLAHTALAQPAEPPPADPVPPTTPASEPAPAPTPAPSTTPAPLKISSATRQSIPSQPISTVANSRLALAAPMRPQNTADHPCIAVRLAGGNHARLTLLRLG